MKKLPSEYCNEQFYATFFSDPTGGRLLDWWGSETCMWSNDYPHAASTWPNSRPGHRRRAGAFAEGYLPQGSCARTLLRLYDLKLGGVNA